ncbi:outer membrane protein assembly factor BamE, partial [Neisseria sp. P0022.S010]|uniref:outer membrane protein assembly factor BamE n=1 Tax=Neisseria sp. P0022.S010 TaxID=3436835 RepID=UPI003F7DE364
MKTIAKVGFALLATGLLAACVTKSKITPEGTTDAPRFHKPYSLTFNKDRGTFPPFDELDQMRPGLTKDDIYKTLGRPHYEEGTVGVREWDYLFHLYTTGVGVKHENTYGVEGITTYQYKVILDKNKFARSFFWNPV